MSEDPKSGLGRRRPGLGRGLSALLDEVGPGLGEDSNAAVPGGGFRGQMVPISRIKPNAKQPRKRFDETAQGELIESVRRQGLLQPILVRPLDGGNFEIVAGERRWRAAQAAQLHDVPIVLRDLSDSEAFEISLVENIQRQDLSAIEEAEGYRRLTGEFGHKQEEVARLVGKSRSHIANLMRLLELPAAVQAMVDRGEIAMGHARALIGTDEPERLAKEIVEGGLNVRDAEVLVKGPGGKINSRRSGAAAQERDADLVELEAHIKDATGLLARLKFDGEGGQLTIRYRDLDQLDMLVARLTATNI
ncbi:ParB/RepB/Spo0J family partition protein [Pacificimonas sp. WHA3]|uniref:ParB/RepB/Spo0J family partition protein n=1 Tax=Pacificimonas pallii TaxID=2827236 RepID=A0ABS6SBH8_9SPHN|nr:ParB/RepB/Spo0J family partition protein [Pacificimonas pallii]MBV7255778.1 ParB/RepB/Spo0J family partition protein [Pacificimonas pallii]